MSTNFFRTFHTTASTWSKNSHFCYSSIWLLAVTSPQWYTKKHQEAVYCQFLVRHCRSSIFPTSECSFWDLFHCSLDWTLLIRKGWQPKRLFTPKHTFHTFAFPLLTRSFAIKTNRTQMSQDLGSQFILNWFHNVFVLFWTGRLWTWRNHTAEAAVTNVQTSQKSQVSNPRL